MNMSGEGKGTENGRGRRGETPHRDDGGRPTEIMIEQAGTTLGGKNRVGKMNVESEEHLAGTSILLCHCTTTLDVESKQPCLMMLGNVLRCPCLTCASTPLSLSAPCPTTATITKAAAMTTSIKTSAQKTISTLRSTDQTLSPSTLSRTGTSSSNHGRRG